MRTDQICPHTDQVGGIVFWPTHQVRSAMADEKEEAVAEAKHCIDRLLAE